MTQTRKIVLFSKDKSMTANIKGSLRTQKSLVFDAHDELLSRMNGSAVDLAKRSDIVMFAIGQDTTPEIGALKALRKSMEDSGVFIALADENLSLAAARQLKEAGVHDVVPYPLVSDELLQRVDFWTRGPEYQVPAVWSGGPRLGRVVAVSEARGGLGATTLAVNLAHRLLDSRGLLRKERNYNVAIVDLDIQFGAVASFLDLEPNDAIYQMAKDGVVPDATYLGQTLVEHSSGLNVLTAPRALCPLDALSHRQVAGLVDALRKDFDFVVIDLPRTLVEWIPAVIDRTDRMLLLTDTSVPSVRQARRLIDIYTEEALNLDLRVIVSRETKPIMARRHHKEAEHVLERRFDIWLPDDAKSCRTAVDRGVPIASAAGRSNLARGIDRIARGLITDLKARNNDEVAAK